MNEKIHDGNFNTPAGCPRGLLHVCTPLSRIASADGKSFICCGETAAAAVPTDRIRLCLKSEFVMRGAVDVMMDLDERDATDTAYVLLGALSAFAQERAINNGQHA